MRRGRGGNRSRKRSGSHASRRPIKAPSSHKLSVAHCPPGRRVSKVEASLSSRNVRPSSAVGGPEVHARDWATSVRRRKKLSNVRQDTPLLAQHDSSAWEFVELLTQHLRRRGFSAGSILALRVVTEGIDSAISTLLLAFHWSVQDARAEWSLRKKRSGGVFGRSFDLHAVVAKTHKQRSRNAPQSPASVVD